MEAATESVTLDTHVRTATGAVAPAWPLDRSIAVNPLWGRVDRPIQTASAEVAARGGFSMLMPRSWYRSEWEAGRLRREHLAEATRISGTEVSPGELEAALKRSSPELIRRERVTDIADQQRDLLREEAWAEFVPHHISQFCAEVFGGETATSDRPLFAEWKRRASVDHGPALRMGLRGFRERAAALPDDAQTLLDEVIAGMELPAREVSAYLESLLLDVNGWASWCAYLRFSAHLEGREDDTLTELLAIRLAWEWILLGCGGRALASRWRHAIASWPEVDRHTQTAHEVDWLLQRAVEVAWQDDVLRQLALPAVQDTAPAVQAVFCIDVRSEVYRRALEAQDPAVHTLGFAGFFGVPAEYVPAGSAASRPQLPGLLAPRFRITDTGIPDVERRSRGLAAAASWNGLKSGPTTTFGFVEGFGLQYAAKLVLDGLGWPAACDDDTKPRLTETIDGAPLTVADKAELAEGILRGMSLTTGFARLVLLAGHGSETRNNPHAAGLDCGACCGQSGAVNARAAAALLNEVEVRKALEDRGIQITAHTHFVPGLHNTTTDELVLFDLDEVPESHGPDLERLSAWLGAAGAAAREERAPTLGVEEASDMARLAALQGRARSWASVRPEWGLAGNAGLIVARRSAIRHLDLKGRSFLHEYRHEQDEGYAVLEGILTAPMLVAHWINLQYYASTVDNRHMGSGDKTLHNVVGGHVGVFEGNGGDLRVGLPLQCVHDGADWVHAPLRLSVFIEAPVDAVQRIVDRHDVVRSLVDNEWVSLFCIDPQRGDTAAYRPAKGAWEAVH